MCPSIKESVQIHAGDRIAWPLPYSVSWEQSDGRMDASAGMIGTGKTIKANAFVNDVFNECVKRISSETSVREAQDQDRNSRK
jgi:hypothetical protein